LLAQSRKRSFQFPQTIKGHNDRSDLIILAHILPGIISKRDAARFQQLLRQH
jgi:hypothetical protein